MESISYKDKKHFLDGTLIQTSPLGKEFKYVGLERNEAKPQQWINKELISHWRYIFHYIDGSGGFIINEFNGSTNIEKLTPRVGNI